MATQIKLRRDSYQNWFDANPTLALGEPAYDTTNNKLKIGNGTTAWRLLGYLADSTATLSLVNGDKTIMLGSDGTLTLPPQAATLQTVEDISTAKIFRATNSTNATAIQEAKDDWFGAELTFADVRDQDEQISGVTRPWSGMPSYEALPLIQEYTPPVGVPPPPGSLRPSATTATNAYLMWKELVSNIDIVSGDKTFSFENTGNLTIPGAIKSLDDNSLNVISTGSNFKVASVSIDGSGGRVFVRADDGSTLKSWEFNDTGVLKLPNGGDIVDSAGNSVLGGGGSGDRLVNGQTEFILNADGSITFPDNTVQTTAYTGQADVNLLSSVNSIDVQTGDTDRWFVRLRREDNEVNPGFRGVTVYSTNYDSQGNAILVAQLDLDQNGGDGIVVAKFTPEGELVWKKSLGAIGSGTVVPHYPESNAVIDSDNNILLAINPDDSQVKKIVKINGTTGAVIFSKVIEFTSNFWIKAMALDSANNIIIGGYFFLDGDDTPFVAKLNPTATSITWQRSFDVVESGYSHIYSVAVDFNDDIIVAGDALVEITVNGSPTVNPQILVAKITEAGGIDWQKTVSLVSDTPYSAASGLSLDSVGNIYVTGTYYVDNAESSSWSGGQGGPGAKKSNAVFLFKMTTLGSIVWDRRVGPGECDWVGVGTAVGDDGDLYLYASTYQRNSAGNADQSFGYWNSALALARYNKTTGAVVWQSYFDNPNSQEIPGLLNDAPYVGFTGVPSTDLMTVQDGKILIGGSVRLGASGADLLDGTPGTDEDYFTQGFIAQFDTAATAWSAEGWSLSTSRIPGRLTNNLTAVNGPVTLANDIAMSPEGNANLATQAVSMSVRRNTSKINTWRFGKDGTFTAPADANIRLQQQQLGSATMYGLIPNNEDDIWFESVCHDADGFAYTLGSNWWTSNRAHIQKFTPEGTVVWNRQIFSGDGASFDVTIVDGVYTTAVVDSGGSGYKVGDRIILSGRDLGGLAVNSLVLSVTDVNNSDNYVGAVDTVTIESGTAATGQNGTYAASDDNDNAKCEVRSMTYDPVSGNIMVVVTTPTMLGGEFTTIQGDAEWTETVVMEIDSGSGTIVRTTTLQDEGDVYAFDTDVSATGKIAVVGQKFNEYNEYGAITPLAGSPQSKIWVAKADIDAEHFPGEAFSNYSDWWITGTGITDQAQVTNVNYYENLSGTVEAPNEAVAAVFSVDIASGAYTNIQATTPGVGYRSGQKFKILGSSLGGATPDNDLTFTVGVDGGGGVNGVINPTGTATGADRSYTSRIPFRVRGTGATFFLAFNPTTGAVIDSGVTSSGQDYLVGDEITILGTSFAGGTVPATNITIAVGSVDGSGAVTGSVNVYGTHPTTHLQLSTSTGLDFTTNGSTFAIKQNVGGEAFVWTPDFTKAIGGPTSDVFTGVVWNAAGTHLYAVGNGQYEVSYSQALVVKFTSAGQITASKFVNDNMGNEDAYDGAVALMANDSIVVVHAMYNNYRDEQDEVLVTKLDSSLNIVWQQFIGIESGDGWTDPGSKISVAVDPATDEILLAWESYNEDIFNDDAIHVVKLDTDGEVVWKRMWGVHESDTRTNYLGYGNKALSIHGNKFTLAGYTDAPDDNYANAFIVTLPLDGTGVGEHGLWTYAEPNDDRIKVWRLSGRTATTFTPTVHTNGITTISNLKYYYTGYPTNEFTFYPQTILSNQGGAIEFADGSKQTFSAAIVPQVKISAGRYTLRPEDSGRHILIESSNYSVIIPNWEKVTLPVGYTVTLVNISGEDAYVECESVNYPGPGLRGSMWFSGGNDKTAYIGFPDNGSGQMITLIKIKEGTRSDDSENHGDIWMVAGADIYNND